MADTVLLNAAFMLYCRYLRMAYLGDNNWRDNSDAGEVVQKFDNFEKLTSVHVNSSDDYMLASGYSLSVAMYDLETGKVARYAMTTTHST
jgi:hypothetical protein